MALVPFQRVTTVSLSFQKSLLPQLEAVSSNLANGTTSGFKRVIAQSTEAKVPVHGGSPISYVKGVEMKRDFTPGAVHHTNNTFDLAILGQGFFQLENGEFTRNGQFQIDNEGSLVNGSGIALMGEGGKIIIPSNAKFVNIGRDGTITTDQGSLGKVGVFTSDAPFEYTTSGNYIVQGEVQPDVKSEILQGYYEESNVNPIEETIKLMEIMRYFEYAQKLIDDQSKRSSQVINLSTRNAV